MASGKVVAGSSLDWFRIFRIERNTWACRLKTAQIDLNTILFPQAQIGLISGIQARKAFSPVVAIASGTTPDGMVVGVPATLRAPAFRTMLILGARRSLVTKGTQKPRCKVRERTARGGRKLQVRSASMPIERKTIQTESTLPKPRVGPRSHHSVSMGITGKCGTTFLSGSLPNSAGSQVFKSGVGRARFPRVPAARMSGQPSSSRYTWVPRQG